MVEIKEKQELKVTNLLSFRGKVKQADLEMVGKEMQEKMQSVGVKQTGPLITATYAIDGENIDVEILVPIDKPIMSVGEYVYKEQLIVDNAVVLIYKGKPTGLQEAINCLKQYIIDNDLRPNTVVYSVTKNVDMLNIENTETRMYVGVNYNVS